MAMRRSHPYPVNPRQDGMTVAAFYAGMAGCSVLIIAVFVALLWVLWPGAARAHDALPTAAMPEGWSYPVSCCSLADCRQVPDSAITEGPNGYVINRTGEVIPMTDKKVRMSPDGLWHWCSKAGLDDSDTICLFTPGRGS